MLETTKNYFFGRATDAPVEKKDKPQYCPFAINDLVYYYGPGERQGRICNVSGISYDENGKVQITVFFESSGEEIETTLAHIRC